MAPRERGAALEGDHVPHLFLSHSSKDGKWVSQLAENFNLCGVDVWFDAWELRVGDDLHERISDAINKSRFVGVVVTKNFSESKWIKGEVHQALSREKAEDRTIVLPFLASGGVPPPVLSPKKFLDFEAEYWPSLVRVSGLIHDLESSRIESELYRATPDAIEPCLQILEHAGWRRSSHLRSDGRDGSLNPSSTSINRERFAMTRFMRVPFSERRQTDSECGDA